MSCRNRRNQSSGKRKQREAQKALEVVTGRKVARFRGAMSQEENWHGLAVRVEVKSGAQCNPIWTKYAAAEAQANAAHAIGDPKPFLMVAMGTRTSDGLVLIRVSQLGRVVEALVDQS